MMKYSGGGADGGDAAEDGGKRRLGAGLPHEQDSVRFENLRTAHDLYIVLLLLNAAVPYGGK